MPHSQFSGGWCPWFGCAVGAVGNCGYTPVIHCLSPPVPWLLAVGHPYFQKHPSAHIPICQLGSVPVIGQAVWLGAGMHTQLCSFVSGVLSIIPFSESLVYQKPNSVVTEFAEQWDNCADIQEYMDFCENSHTELVEFCDKPEIFNVMPMINP